MRYEGPDMLEKREEQEVEEYFFTSGVVRRTFPPLSGIASPACTPLEAWWLQAAHQTGPLSSLIGPGQ